MNGDRLGPYRVLGGLGSGSTARVYLAEVVDATGGLASGRRVALKLLHPQFDAAPQALHRFRQEVEVGRVLEHENVVRLLDAGTVPLDGRTRHFLAMEYVEGRTLRALMTEDGLQPEGLCRHIACEVAQGLAAIHRRGVVHRDIKPENILLTSDENVKIMDLGVARLRDEGVRVSQSGDFIGSVLYAAPEQFRGPPQGLDGRADLYSLGLTLYELATGVHPFKRDTIEEVMHLQLSEMPRSPGEIQPRLSSFFEYVLLRLLRKSPAQRFRSAETFGQTLELAEESSWWRERVRLIRGLSRRPPRRPRMPRETSVHGREGELDGIRALWHDVTQGRGRVLVVVGEAGIGKSRLIDEFVARIDAAGEDAHVLYGAWPAVGPATTMGALCTAYRDHFGSEEIQEALAPFLTEAPVLVRPFSALLCGAPHPAGAEPLGRGELHAAFLHVTRALSLERPTVVVLEDLQHATQDGRDVVAALAQGIQDHRVLLILTARSGVREAWTAEHVRSPHIQRLGLSRLRGEDVVSLLAETLGSETLAGRLAPRLAALSDGNPLFLFEVLQGLKEQGTLARAATEDAWSLRGTLRDARTPPRMRDLVQVRLAGLSTEDREVLDAAAAFGFEFDPALLAEVLDRHRLPVLQTLGRLERSHHLVRSRGWLCTFDHHVLQETLYADLPPPLRRAYHAAIGEALQGRLSASQPAGADAVAACHHLLLAGRGGAALVWLEDALDHLEEGYQNARAADLVDRVLAAPGLVDRSPRARLLLRKAGRLRLMGRAREEAQALEEAVCMASPKHDPLLASEAFTRLGDHLRAAGHLERARSFLEQAVTLARRAGSQGAEVEAHCSHGIVLDDLGRHADAHEVLRRSLESARSLGDHRAEARSQRSLARSLLNLGETESALEELRASVTLSEVSGGLHEQGRAAAQLGSVLVDLGRSEEARPHLERAQEIAQIVGDRAAGAAVLGDLGKLNVNLGYLAEAESCLESSLAILRESSSPLDLGRALTRSGELELLLGRPSRARARLEEACDRLREIGGISGEARALRSLARVADEEERSEAALDLFGRALDLCQRAVAPEEAAATRVAWALSRFWRDEPEAAAETLTHGDAGWRSAAAGSTSVLVRALDLALGLEDNEGVVRSALRRSPTPWIRYEAHALLYFGRGWEEDLEISRRTIQALRERAPADAWNDFLRGVRVRRRVSEAWTAQHTSGAGAGVELRAGTPTQHAE